MLRASHSAICGEKYFSSFAVFFQEETKETEKLRYLRDLLLKERIRVHLCESVVEVPRACDIDKLNAAAGFFNLAFGPVFVKVRP